MAWTSWGVPVLGRTTNHNFGGRPIGTHVFFNWLAGCFPQIVFSFPPPAYMFHEGRVFPAEASRKAYSVKAAMA